MPRLGRPDSGDASGTGSPISSQQFSKKKERSFMTSLKRLLRRQQRGAGSAADLRPSSSRATFIATAASSTELLSPVGNEGSTRGQPYDPSAPHACRAPPRPSSSMPVLLPLPGSNSSASGLPSFSGSPAQSVAGRKVAPTAGNSTTFLQLPAIEPCLSANSCSTLSERIPSGLGVGNPPSRLRHLGPPPEHSPHYLMHQQRLSPPAPSQPQRLSPQLQPAGRPSPPQQQQHQQQLQRLRNQQQQLQTQPQQQQQPGQQALCDPADAGTSASGATDRSCTSLPLIRLGPRNSGFMGPPTPVPATAATAATREDDIGKAGTTCAGHATGSPGSNATAAAVGGGVSVAPAAPNPEAALAAALRPASAAAAIPVSMPATLQAAAQPAASPVVPSSTVSTASMGAPLAAAAAQASVSNLLAVCPAAPEAMRRSVWRFADYTIAGRLYKGDVSSVYKAVCNHSGLKVVLKVYSLGRVADNALHTLVREVRIHTDLAHDNVLMMYGVFEESNRLVLVLERAIRGDLFHLHRSLPNCRMSEDQLRVLVLAPLLEALVYLHGRGVCHRDIKPENLLMTATWQLRLADFGAAIDLTQERAVTRTGTMDYMAPEVERCPLKMLPEDNKDNPELAYTTAVDVWSVGVLAYEMLVGFPPFIDFQGQSAMVGAGGEAPRELHFPHFVSAGGQDFISMALAEGAGDRPTAAQLLRHPWLKHAVRQHHTRQQQQQQQQAPPEHQQQQQQQQPQQPTLQQVTRPQTHLRHQMSAQVLGASSGGAEQTPPSPAESLGRTGPRGLADGALKPTNSVLW